LYEIDGISFKITRKRGLKHTYIYVREGEIEVRAALLVRKKRIFEFVRSKKEWIKKQQLKVSQTPITPDIDKAKLKKDAKVLINPLVAKWALSMGVDPKSVGYRYNKSRWGSCSHENRLNFNTKLAMMNPKFVEYVVVHELAHIRHKNHSSAFWAEVEKFLPDFKNRKKLIHSQK